MAQTTTNDVVDGDDGDNTTTKTYYQLICPGDYDAFE